VEQDGLPHVDSKEAHMPYSFEFAAAIYALASTVLAMYVTVIELVTKRMNSVNQEGSKLENFAWGYVMIYPLVIMLIITAVCLETMSREYIFYAYLRNGILLDLADANTNVLSIEYWDPRTSSAGLFPHACIISTIILGLVTRGWSSSLIIVCGQTFHTAHLLQQRAQPQVAPRQPGRIRAKDHPDADCRHASCGEQYQQGAAQAEHHGH
jgi:hypothetical protein